jgi:hypothetical protein
LTIDVRPDDSDGIISDIPSPDDLMGLTFYIPDEAMCHVRTQAATIDDLQFNPPDYTGRRSVTVPWSSLEFPEV